MVNISGASNFTAVYFSTNKKKRKPRKLKMSCYYKKTFCLTPHRTLLQYHSMAISVWRSCKSVNITFWGNLFFTFGLKYTIAAKHVRKLFFTNIIFFFIYQHIFCESKQSTFESTLSQLYVPSGKRSSLTWKTSTAGVLGSSASFDRETRLSQDNSIQCYLCLIHALKTLFVNENYQLQSHNIQKTIDCHTIFFFFFFFVHSYFGWCSDYS